MVQSFGMPRAMSLTFYVVLLVLPVSGNPVNSSRHRRKHVNVGVVMPHHSIEAPMDYNLLLRDWVVSGASYFSREHLVLHPGVPSLSGFAWNKHPLLSNYFETTLSFKVTSADPGSVGPHDQHFAFWYVAENVIDRYNEQAVIAASSWESGLKAQDFVLAGSKARFDGFGVVFTPNDASSRRPKVSLLRSDGTQEFSQIRHLPASNAKDVEFRNSAEPVQLRIRVRAVSIKILFRQRRSSEWTEVFEIDTTDAIKANGYVGLTGVSGSGNPDAVIFTELEIQNLDSTSIGETMEGVNQSTQESYQEMLSSEHQTFPDQAAQTKQLLDALRKLGDHMNLAKPMDQQMIHGLQALTARVDALNQGYRTLKQESHFLLESGGEHASHQSSFDMMKHEIAGLRTILARDTAVRNEKLSQMQTSVDEVKERASRRTRESGKPVVPGVDIIKQSVRSGTNQTRFMFLVILVSASGVGWLLYQRMHYYEKKHFV